jgi:hypothetical protein
MLTIKYCWLVGWLVCSRGFVVFMDILISFGVPWGDLQARISIVLRHVMYRAFSSIDYSSDISRYVRVFIEVHSLVFLR